MTAASSLPSTRATETASARSWWIERLGAAPDPAGAWHLGPTREPLARGTRGEIHQLKITSFGTELMCELLIPHDVPRSGLVVVVPFYDTLSVFGEPTARSQLTGKDPALNAHGLQLAEAGHEVLAVPWWFEHIAAADPSTAGATSLDERYGRAAERHRREQPTTGLGRSIGDLMLAVTALQDSGIARSDRIGAFGHSLGGKLSMHLASLDTRIERAAAHEPGLGFAHSNWADPWYLGDAVPRARDQDEVLGLAAPRPFLLSGGGASDGEHNVDLVRSARTRWPESTGLDSLLHDHGHALPPRVMSGDQRVAAGAGKDSLPRT